MKNLILLIMFLSFFSNLFSQPKSDINAPKWSYDKNIYEVNLRQYTQSGTIKEFMLHLPRLKELGVGILWFMPIHPIGELNRKGTMGSYYSVKDYKGLDPSLGTKDDFRDMVKEIHNLGMYVIIDWVANHTSWDNVWTTENPDFYKKDSLGKFVPPVADWSDVIALDYNNKKLWTAMTEAMEYWIKEFDIDGYRCDVAGMVPTPFWNSLRPKLDKIKPVFMLAEWESPELHEKAFDMTYSWDLHHVMSEVTSGKKPAKELFTSINKEKKKYPLNSFRMRFTNNHDENSWNGTEFEKFGDAAVPLAVFSATVPGMLLIYNGQEVGNTKRLSFFEKDLIDWEGKTLKPGRNNFTILYQKLNQLKKDNPSLWNGTMGGDFKPVKNNGNEKVLSFFRQGNNFTAEDERPGRKGKNIVLVFINLSPEKQNVSLLRKDNLGKYKDYFTGSVVNFSKKSTIELNGWDFKVLIKQ